jgi:hypothetical protein
LPCRRLATAGNEALGRRGLPSPHRRFTLRSACLADGSLSRATRRLAGGGCSPHVPRFPLRSACLADSPLPWVMKRLVGGGCCSHTPAFRCARLVLQTARYRGQRNAGHVGAAAPHPPVSAALGLSYRRLATADNETLAIMPHARALVHSAMTRRPRQISRVGARMRWQLRLFGYRRTKLLIQPAPL